jgi:hypothetical protein
MWAQFFLMYNKDYLCGDNTIDYKRLFDYNVLWKGALY